MRAKRRVRLATGRTVARLDGAAQPGTAMTGVTGLGAVVDCRAAADRAATAHPALIRRVVAIAAIGTIAGIAVPALVAADGSSNTREHMARRKKPHWLPEIQWVVLRKHFIVFDETLHRNAFGIA